MSKFKEEDIRPKKLFDNFLELLKDDSITYFKDSIRELIDCPCCNSKKYSHWLTKEDFEYQICDDCHTIFQSPRPLEQNFKNFYTKSKSVKFWATSFYKETKESRVKFIWKPKAKLIFELISSKDQENVVLNLIDVGGGYGLFSDEINKLNKFNTYIIEPAIELAKICSEKGYNVINKFAEDIDINLLPKGRSCFVSFELLEHVYNPSKFIKHLYSLMKKDDMLILTTLNGMGLDILHLKGKSKSISPPQHINFLNPNSIKKLMLNTGFINVETLTPGKLDLDILLKGSDDYYWHQISKYLGLDKMQKIISENKLSSHMMVICVK